MSSKPTAKSGRINALVRPSVRQLSPYQVAPADGLVKLDAMESPYGVPESLYEDWLVQSHNLAINRYPDPNAAELKAALRQTFGIQDQHQIVLGNGSDELIQMIALLVGGNGRVIMAPTPTFSMYQIIATVTGSEFVGVPLTAQFELDLDAFLAAMHRHQPACVFLAYPNNPSGNCFDQASILAILDAAPGIVVLDEAYFAFCERSFLDKLDRYGDLMVMRTLSKSGMAALRLGFLVAHPDWAAQLEKIRLPYNISSFTQRSACFYLAQYAVLQRHAAQIIAQRQVVFSHLQQMPRLHPYPSDANFILLRSQTDPDALHQRLMNHGVLIKNLHPTLAQHLRVTIGSETQNARFLDALS